MVHLLDFLKNFFLFFESTIGNYPFLLGVTTVAFLFKLYIVYNIITVKMGRATNVHKILLLMVIVGSMMGDFAWILKLSQALFFPYSFTNFITRFIRFAWAATVIQYQALALFLEKMPSSDRKTFINKKNVFLLIISSMFFFLFFICCITNTGSISNYIIWKAEYFFHLYSLFLLIPISLLFVNYQIKKTFVPSLLKQQLKIFIKIFVIPQLIADFLQFYHFDFSEGYIASSFAFVGISTMLLAIATYYCARKIMGLRFLNFADHVQSSARYGFVDRIKHALDQLSQINNVQDIHRITQHFFNTAFQIPIKKIKLHLRLAPLEEQQKNLCTSSNEGEYIENALLHYEKEMGLFLQINAILIYDEIAFTNFYEEDYYRSCALSFLQQINADIFIPIYKDKQMIACITIERNSRAKNRFYSDVERDEMLVFSQYISNVIHLIQNRSLSQLIENEHALEEELYRRHQELAQYKEGLHSLLRNNKPKEVGILFYRNHRLFIGNDAAQKLIGFEIISQSKHPIHKKLKQLAELAQEDRDSHSCNYTDAHDNKIIARASPGISHNHIAITVHYADACDLIKEHINHLKNPTHWDYLLYLETTRSGQLINQLIPGSGQTLLSFKIDLLKAALSKKALLLDLPESDLIPSVEILHHIGLRNQLYILKLQHPTTTLDMMAKLFGINPLLGYPYQQQPILEVLGGTDTLFIQNIHLLDLECQEHLAELIRYGSYRMFKSDQKKISAVRLVCSTNQELSRLVQKEKFSTNLFNELKKTSLVMPSLIALSESEVYELAQGFGKQTFSKKDDNNSLELTKRDINSITIERPLSLHEFKNKVQQLVKQKSQNKAPLVEQVFNPASITADSDLIEIAHLGKHALRDPKIVAILWHKFKNQNKIAHFLGVNRSSVNRRCKKYNIE